MNEPAPKGGWKLKRDSMTKLIVWFTDGNIRTMYSIDWKNRYGQRDRGIGLERFQKRIVVYGSKVRIARIYDLATGELIQKHP